MGLFTLKNNIVQIDPDTLAIPEFLVIYNRDKSKTKDLAYKELSYIYFKTDYKSPYQSYPENKREDALLKDFIRDSTWKADKAVLEAISKYEEFQQTPSMRLAKAIRKAQDKVTDYLDTGESDLDIKDYVSVIEKAGKMVESSDKVEDKVKKEITAAEKIRGGGAIKSRER